MQLLPDVDDAGDLRRDADGHGQITRRLRYDEADDDRCQQQRPRPQRPPATAPT